MSDDKTIIGRREVIQGFDRERLNACLVVLSGRSIGKMYRVPVGHISMGRSLDNEIRLEDEGISRAHARITRAPDLVTLVDLRSTNGTFVNGERVSDKVLNDGDRIQLGSVTILKFTFQDSLEEQFQQQLYESATRDPLTQSYNKRFFIEQFEKDFRHALRQRLELSLVTLDVDHFKRINDKFGHPAGDHVLQRLASTVMGTLRTEDAFCRIGGEEFAIILRDQNADAAWLLADRLRKLVEETQFAYNGHDIPVTSSFGVAAYIPGEHNTVADLISASDQYLYEAKRKGRNRVAGPR